MYGDLNEGWMRFLAYGEIEGQFVFHKMVFQGGMDILWTSMNERIGLAGMDDDTM